MGPNEVLHYGPWNLIDKKTLVGFLEERVVDAVRQYQSDQRVIHAGNPAVVRRPFALWFIGQNLRGTDQHQGSCKSPNLRKHFSHVRSSLKSNKEKVGRILQKSPERTQEGI